MILGEGAAMAVLGLAIGGLAAVPLSRFLAGLLFGVQPADPLTIATAAGLLLLVALIAAWVPARAATNVDPIAALRSQ
jgi:ABC-type antimicrobial peptide transport system permease subunit